MKIDIIIDRITGPKIRYPYLENIEEMGNYFLGVWFPNWKPGYLANNLVIKVPLETTAGKIIDTSFIWKETKQPDLHRYIGTPTMKMRDLFGVHIDDVIVEIWKHGDIYNIHMKRRGGIYTQDLRFLVTPKTTIYYEDHLVLESP